jgi:hypothetical protein
VFYQAKLDKSEIVFDITENGATVEVSAVNEKTPPPPTDIPKTGDTSNIALQCLAWGHSGECLGKLP